MASERSIQSSSLARVEAYRVLRSNLLVSLNDLESPTVLVTSAYAEEGKTSTAAHLAASLAAAGYRVVAVDLDLRHPNLHSWFGLHNEFGVSDVLLGRRPVEECLQYAEVGEGPNAAPRGLYAITTGPAVKNPAELLGTNRTGELLRALAGQADVVLIDSPPVLLVADTLVIGRIVAGALLVVQSRRTPMPAVQQAKDALIRNQTRLLGIVINKALPRDALDAGYGYGYGYPYGGKTDPSGNGEGDR